jgi:hypothetical protein
LIEAHGLCERDRIAGELATSGIETLRCQNGLPHTDQPSRREIFSSRIGSGRHRGDTAGLATIQRAQPEGLGRAKGHEKKLPAAGQKTWYTVAALPVTELCRRRYLAARCRYARQWSSWTLRKQDHSLLAPRALCGRK